MKNKASIVVAILLLAVGFAAISTTLIINGSAKVSENADDFSVIFTKATLDGADVYANVIDDTKKVITFETSDLKTLNQTSVLDYEVTNNSANYDAEVQVNCKTKENTTAKYTSIKNELDGNATVIKAKETLNGTLTLTLNKVATEEVREEYVCTLTLNAVERDTLGDGLSQFEKDDWPTIAANVKSGNTDKYNVGDTKEVDLGDLGTHTVRVANKSKCTNGETSETACGFVVEFADIITKQPFNSSHGNEGGWKDSSIRTYINDTIYKSLPTDLQNVIASTKVISGHGYDVSADFETQDKLYLLSGHEVHEDGTSYKISEVDTSYNKTKQLDYYKQKRVTTTDNCKETIKKYNGSDLEWWLRSITNDASYRYNLKTGYPDCWSRTDLYWLSSGVSPAFRIA